LADDLTKRGHIVIFASHEGYLRSFIEVNGFAFYYLHLFQDQALPPSKRWREEVPEQCLENEGREFYDSLRQGVAHRKMIEELRPDVVLIECSFDGVASLPLFATGIRMMQIIPILPETHDTDNVPPSRTNWIQWT
jgi:hypothetical protein